MVNLSPIEYSWHRKHASINETVIYFCKRTSRPTRSSLGSGSSSTLLLLLATE